MNEHDLSWLQEALAPLLAGDRVSVSIGRGGFTLHGPTITAGAACDFEIHGKRRIHVGDARQWRESAYRIAKILLITGGRIILQDVYGKVLVFGGVARADAEWEKAGFSA